MGDGRGMDADWPDVLGASATLSALLRLTIFSLDVNEQECDGGPGFRRTRQRHDQRGHRKPLSGRSSLTHPETCSLLGRASSSWADPRCGSLNIQTGVVVMGSAVSSLGACPRPGLLVSPKLLFFPKILEAWRIKERERERCRIPNRHVGNVRLPASWQAISC